MYITERLKDKGRLVAMVLSLLALPAWADATEQISTPSQQAGQPKQQQKSRLLQGRIIDENNEPLIGVTIQVEGAPAKAVSDIDGNYQIYVP